MDVLEILNVAGVDELPDRLALVRAVDLMTKDAEVGLDRAQPFASPCSLMALQGAGSFLFGDVIGKQVEATPVTMDHMLERTEAWIESFFDGEASLDEVLGDAKKGSALALSVMGSALLSTSVAQGMKYVMASRSMNFPGNVPFPTQQWSGYLLHQSASGAWP